MNISNDLSFISPKSAIYNLVAGAETTTVGKKTTVSVPVIQFEDIEPTFGEKIGKGIHGTVFDVKGVEDSRVYKVISKYNLKNGDEIKIMQIAQELGLGPVLYSVFAIGENHVVIEMEKLGKPLKTFMAEIGAKPPRNENENARYKIHQMMRDTEKDSPYQTLDPEPFYCLQETAIEALYKSPEDFYFEYFSVIKRFAERNVTYRDPNCGNIIPNKENGKGMQLIDYDQAKIKPDMKTAIEKAMKCKFNQQYLSEFKKLSNLSTKSRELICLFDQDSTI